MKLIQPVPLSLVLLCLVVSACGSALPEVTVQPESLSPFVKSQEGSPVPTETIATNEPPDIVRDEPIVVEIIGRAMTDLAERLGIPEDQIRVIDVKEVTWPDASLGCPQPGTAYAQVTTPGYQIVLEALGEQYPYHTDLEAQLILCQEELFPNLPVNPGEIDDGKPWMPVDPIEPGT